MRRSLVATVAGAAVGVVAFALLVLAGFLLYERLWTGSGVLLVAVLLIFGAIGGYAGWLLGMVVFSAVRGAAERVA